MKFSESLKKSADFKTVYRRGTSCADKRLILYANRNGTGRNRLGISASKKYGNSVERHLFQRRIRAIYRLQEEAFHSGWDVVVVARSRAKDAEYSELEKSFLYLAKKARLLKTED
ncbi:MAG: ribonuclease P protein component [Lachnospiraceae bacterium]|nr:ribonuclease P protein component [Lachnospiraceae bacterium]